MDPEPGDRVARELLRCVACYSLLPRIRDAAEARLAGWACSRPVGEEAAGFCIHAAPFLLQTADRLPQGPALLDRVLRHVWLGDLEPVGGDAYLNLRATLHRLPANLRPPGVMGRARRAAGPGRPAREGHRAAAPRQPRPGAERCVHRYRAATAQALREWAQRLARPT
ncbi:MAG: hypothetical protein M5U09_26560 [Gammaproteobacteria bacterium]|nr:hypothetical protein [Gammaproteobacteria bacterium]